jgi:predicted transcriptional regulator
MITKEKVIESLKTFPSEFSIDDLIEKLIFIEKIEKGLQDSKDGKTRTHKEIKKIVGKW